MKENEREIDTEEVESESARANVVLGMSIFHFDVSLRGALMHRSGSSNRSSRSFLVMAFGKRFFIIAEAEKVLKWEPTAPLPARNSINMKSLRAPN